MYTAGPVRYAALGTQIVLLLLTSAYALSSMHQAETTKRNRYRAIALFGLITAVFLIAQIWFPYLPLYSVAYMLGTSLLHTFVVANEREEYKLGMCADVTDLVRIQHEYAMTKEDYERERSIGIIHAHIAQALAHGFEDLYYVNLETEEFIEYRANGRRGALTEVRCGENFFDECKADANVFVHPDDRAAFKRGMDRETLVDALDRNGSFVMTYRFSIVETTPDAAN